MVRMQHQQYYYDVGGYMFKGIRTRFLVIGMTLSLSGLNILPQAQAITPSPRSYDNGMLVTTGFEEPLIALGKADEAQTQALKIALGSYFHQTDALALEPITQFLSIWPSSPWRVSLLTNMGLIYYHNGAFTPAIAAWEAA